MATRADMRMYHYIYKTTRDDGKYYIGMHSTDDLNDGYQGSGTLLTKSVKKHGADRHQTEILEFLGSRSLLKDRERQIVNEEILDDHKCMNLQLGGGGFIQWHADNAETFHRSGWEAIMASRTYSNESKAIRMRNALATYQKNKDAGLHAPMTHWQGRKHSEETKQKMRKPRGVGAANSQFGKRCSIMNNGQVSKRVPLEEVETHLADGWTKGFKKSV